MARQIDADALNGRIDKCVTLSGIGLEPLMAVRDIKALISAMPIIDAIPMDWMNEKMQNPQVTCVNPFGFVLAEWLEDGMQCD